MNNPTPNTQLLNQKIALGTVQFGRNYGINNKTGIISDNELKKLLEFVKINDINTLDTAYNYGNSESRLGQILADSKMDFKIISKAPRGVTNLNLKSYIDESLARLHSESLYGYLFHDFNDYSGNKNIFLSFQELKKESKIFKIGFSIYYPEQIEMLLEDKTDFDIIQIPYNIADRRFEQYFGQLKIKNVEIHTRSVFLQGLFFIKSNELKGKLKPFENLLVSLKSISEETNRSIQNICLNFAIQNKYIDKVVIGVDNIEQLKENTGELLNQLSNEEIQLINSKIEEIEIPQDLLIPSNWN